jgi:hypothetical protein
MHHVFLQNMNADLRPPLEYFTKGIEMVLGGANSNDPVSKLVCGEAKNIHSATGTTIHHAHLSEVARYATAESIKESIIPACSDSPNTVRILESTAHFSGGSDYFRDQCERAMAGDSEFQYQFVAWWLMPEYSVSLDKGEKMKLDAEEKGLVKDGLTFENIKWRRNKISELEGDVDSFRLNYPMNYNEGWITKMGATFARDRMAEMFVGLRPPVKRFRVFNGRLYEDPQGELAIWVMPQEGKVYDVGADVAEGHDDGDWSTAEVISRGSNEQCAEYRAHVMPREFADILAAIGRYYNHAQIAPEVNNCGLATSQRLAEIYPNIYLFRKQDTVAPKLTGKMGWQTTYDSKGILVELARERVYRRECRIYSRALWDEMNLFARDYTPTGMTVYRAATGFDDLVIAWLIALKASDDEDFSKYHNVGAPVARAPERMDNAGVDVEWAGLLGSPNGNTQTGSWD